MHEVRVLLADDSAMAREAVTTILQADARFVVVGEAANGEEAVEMANTLKPDLILMDINMPRCGAAGNAGQPAPPSNAAQPGPESGSASGGGFTPMAAYGGLILGAAALAVALRRR